MVFVSKMFFKPVRPSPNLLRRYFDGLDVLKVFYCSSRDNPLPDNSDFNKLLNDAANFEHETDKDWATTPYPVTSGHRKAKTDVKKPLVDPKDTSILLFPGQGTLKVGKIKEYLNFPQVKDMFEIANEALGYNIRQICESGPQDVLNRTEYNQPATVLTSLAAVEKLRDERPLAVDSCVSAAGYSVGEIAALMFTGALNFEAGIRLVGVRAATMQEASESSPQAMLSVLCTAEAKLSTIVQEAEKWALDLGVEKPVCRIAIYLYTQCKIIAGNKEAIRYIEKNGKNMGLIRMRRIPVSGAFHTPLMQPALAPFKLALDSVQFHVPVVPVYSNVTGNVHRNDPYLMKKALIKQLVSPVKWEQIMHNIYSREPGVSFPRTFDVGSAGSMKHILRNVNSKAWDSAFIV